MFSEQSGFARVAVKGAQPGNFGRKRFDKNGWNRYTVLM
jgi:hypothetical protein